MTTVKPASLGQWWTIKQILPELQQLNQIPLFGKSPPFDWDKYSSLLAHRFDLHHFSIQPIDQKWQLADQVTQGFGSDVTIFPIDLSPLGTSIYWIMSQQDIKKLTSWVLSKDPNTSPLISDLLQEGFYRYLLLEAIDAAVEIEPLQAFTPILHEQGSLPESNVFCIDIALQCQEKTCTGRLVIPNETRSGWIRHFDRQSTFLKVSRSLEHLELSVGVKTGSVLLHQSDWQKLKKGDFVLLDQGSYDPRHGDGLAVLILGETPLFQLTIQKYKIYLLNYACIYEDATDMNSRPSPEEKPMEDAAPIVSSSEETNMVSIKEAPLYITVELARLHMTLGQLTQLTPGNLLELPIEPDQDVTLSINGRKVGKAELVYLGERLGIRITEFS